MSQHLWENTPIADLTVNLQGDSQVLLKRRPSRNSGGRSATEPEGADETQFDESGGPPAFVIRPASF